MAGTVQDITERKRAEEALRESEERWRVLFEDAADVILLFEITPDGVSVIRDANGATFRLLGYKRDELIGQPVSFLEAAFDAPSIVENRRRHIHAGTRKTFEVGHRCKDGTKRIFECSVTEVRVGSKTLVLSVERDITERRRAEETTRRAEDAARQANLLLQRTFDTIPDLVTVHDRNLRVVLSNWHGRGHVPQEERDSLPHCYSCYMRREQPCEPCPTMEVFRTKAAVTAEVENHSPVRSSK